MIIDGIKMDNKQLIFLLESQYSDTGELDEAQEEIKSNLRMPSEHTTEDSPLLLSPTTEEKMCNPQDSVIVQIFLMIFFAEWGDRSQVSTILLAGTHPVFSVFCGGCVGYFITSFMAVLCGSVLQKWISPRWITIFGGLMFILFAFQTVLSHQLSMCVGMLYLFLFNKQYLKGIMNYELSSFFSSGAGCSSGLAAKT